MPLSADRAVQLRRVVFVVVNAGRPPQGDWSRTLDGPSGTALLNAVTDTAIDSAVRSGFDAFRLTLREWEGAVRKWRCGLPAHEARKHSAGAGWRCNDIAFEISEISFDRLDPATAARLSDIPTRFRLPVEDVDLLIDAGMKAVAGDPVLRRTTKSAARDHADEVATRVPVGRIGTDEDMAGAAIHLASRAGDYVVGATIAVDGGIVYANPGIKGSGWDGD